MIIKSITLNNIGPYVNDNVLKFKTDKNKKMVLIGGKNGAGKTTLFNAIKICLYGCISYGYESNNSKYYSEIDKLINSNEKLSKNASAYVGMTILFDDGKYDYSYKLTRSWKIRGKRISESFDVYKDEKLLSDAEKSDFENYLLQLLPPNLFKFYFFDGERISDFIFNGIDNSDFKDAFLKLCNLDTMEIIRNNFIRISRGKIKGADSAAEYYEKCLAEDLLMKDRIVYAEEEYNEIEKKVFSIDEKIAILDKEYSKSGGISKAKWKHMHEQLSREKIRREETRKWLKETSNNVLPFIILKNELTDLQNQIEIEHNAQANSNLKDLINTPEIKKIIKKVLLSAGVELKKDISGKIIKEINNYADSTSDIVPILNLSESDQLSLTAKINSLLAFDTNRIKEVTSDINNSQKASERIRKKMETTSIDDYDEYLQKKVKLNEEKADSVTHLLELDKELQDLKSQKSVSSSRLIKAKTDYENHLKKQSVNDISARALLAFEELQNILYNNSIRLTETNFRKYFNSLINKSDLIDGIYIDNNLNVLPYKIKSFEASDIKSILEKNGEEYLISQIGLYAYDRLKELLKNGETSFELPVEVKQQLSAGEKQIFIMALYQSLSRLNKINVPYIIDTPFARIDKEHRNNILEQFFKKLDGQVIILSTDEEIVDEYEKTVSDVISDRFLLDHTIEGTTEIIENSYFGEIL